MKSKAKTQTKILPISLRPHRLSQMVGQKSIVAAIQKQMEQRQPSAFLFSGPSGCGKTTLARIIAVALQCEHQQEWGEPCEDCWNQWDQFTIHEANASETNGVEEIGQIAELAQYAPTPPSRKRIVILDEAHLMSNNAQNLLLKHFEDPPESTVWIICTTLPSKILATLRRRCMTYQVKPLSYEGRSLLLNRAAKEAGITRPLKGLLAAADAAQLGSPGLLLMALEQYAAGIDATVAVAGADVSGVDTLAICRAVGVGDTVALCKALAPASPEAARWIRASVGGYLRGMIVRERIPTKAERLAVLLAMLMAGNAPLDDATLFNWLWATLFVIARKIHSHAD